MIKANGQRAFVTGATGMLGGELARQLHQNDFKVTASGRNQERARELIKQGIPFQPMDLNDRDSLIQAVSGHELVFHCAAFSSPWGEADQFIRVNVEGTRNLLDAAVNAGISHFLFVSSSSVYFDFKDRFDIRESDPLPGNPVTAYTHSKRLAEELVQSVAVKDGLQSTIIRPRGIIGAGDRSIAPRLLKVAERGFVPLPNGGNALVDVTCVEDVANALICASQKKTSQEKAGIYNITSGQPVYVRNLIKDTLEANGMKARLIPLPTKPLIALARLGEFISKATHGREPLATAYGLGLLAYGQTLDISKAKRDFDWKPLYLPAHGIKQFARWWRATDGN